MELPKVKAGFVGFGEVNSPRDLLEGKLERAREALRVQGLELVSIALVTDDPERRDERRARDELASQDFDFLVICVAGWIPSQTVVNVVSDFTHKPMVLWGLTGEYKGDRLITTADQAGTSALRDPLEGLGFTFRYLWDTPDAPYAAAERVADFGRVVKAAALLRQSRVGMVGYRDMHLYGTQVDGVSLRRVLGPEVEIFSLLEAVQGQDSLDQAAVEAVIGELRRRWEFVEPVPDSALEKGVRLYLSIMEKVRQRDYQGVSVMDVEGVKKLLHFPPAMVLMLLADLGGVASIPENDGLGVVTQLMVRYLTGQVGAYFEFYEYFRDSLLMGVPDYVPSEVVEGPVLVRPWPGFGGLRDGILNVSRVKTGRAIICRLASRGDRYRMHIVSGEATSPRKWEEAGWEPPAPQLPSIEFVPDISVEEFGQNVLSQHYIIAYGDHRRALEELCRLLGVEVIG